MGRHPYSLNCFKAKLDHPCSDTSQQLRTSSSRSRRSAGRVRVAFDTTRSRHFSLTSAQPGQASDHAPARVSLTLDEVRTSAMAYIDVFSTGPMVHRARSRRVKILSALKW